MKNTILTLILLTTCIQNVMAETQKASALYQDLNPAQKKALKSQMKKKGISHKDLEDIELSIDPNTKNIDVSANSPSAKKHALFVALRLGFPILAGIGIVYRNESVVPFNVSLNAQTIILASSYNAGVAWNFYKGFFVGATLHYIKTNNVWGGGNESKVFYGAQVGYQHSLGKTKRWYIDGRLEILKTEDKLIPNGNIGFGVRFW